MMKSGRLSLTLKLLKMSQNRVRLRRTMKAEVDQSRSRVKSPTTRARANF